MADKPTLPPASAPFPGSRTPGWNDPPTLPYNPTTTTNPGRTRLNLTKRVAFPLQGTAGGDPTTAKPTAIVQPNQASMGSGGLPPPPMSLSPAATATQPIAVVHPMPNMNAPSARVPVSTAGSAPPSAALPADALEYVTRVFGEHVGRVQETSNVRREEIERRLALIEQLWQSGNLSTAIKQRVHRLAKAIADSNFNEAMEIYTALLANHSSECAMWAVALRHIVLTVLDAGVASSMSVDASGAMAPTSSAASSSTAMAAANRDVAQASLSASATTTAVPASSESSNIAVVVPAMHI